jgi:hypothetical protein
MKLVGRFLPALMALIIFFAIASAQQLQMQRRVIKQYFPLDNPVFVLIGKASEIESVAKKYAPKMDTKSISQTGF